jgi:hypothetical protein
MIHQIGIRADNLQRTSLAPVALKSLGGLRVLDSVPFLTCLGHRLITTNPAYRGTPSPLAGPS